LTEGGTQTEKVGLASRSLTTASDAVSKETAGSVLRLTEQDVDWSDPRTLDEASLDLAESYGIATETSVATKLAAALEDMATADFDIDTGDAGDLVVALAAAAVSVHNTSKALPDVVVAGLATWEYLAGIIDGSGRALYPNLAPNSASASVDGNPLGLKFVIVPSWETGLVVGCSRFLRTWEDVKGLIDVADPGHMEVEVAYRGYFAAHVYPQGFCQLAPE